MFKHNTDSYQANSIQISTCSFKFVFKLVEYVKRIINWPVMSND